MWKKGEGIATFTRPPFLDVVWMDNTYQDLLPTRNEVILAEKRSETFLFAWWFNY